MVATSTEIDGIIQSFAVALMARIRVEAIILYGSYARGTAYEQSDVDIAVISPDFEGVPMYRRQEVIADLTYREDARLSAIGYPSSEYHRPKPYAFLAEIVRTGRVVYPRTSE
jgi:predicted nucleotidyltransferase